MVETASRPSMQRRIGELANERFRNLETDGLRVGTREELKLKRRDGMDGGSVASSQPLSRNCPETSDSLVAEHPKDEAIDALQKQNVDKSSIESDSLCKNEKPSQSTNITSSSIVPDNSSCISHFIYQHVAIYTTKYTSPSSPHKPPIHLQPSPSSIRTAAADGSRPETPSQHPLA